MLCHAVSFSLSLNTTELHGDVFEALSVSDQLADEMELESSE